MFTQNALDCSTIHPSSSKNEWSVSGTVNLHSPDPFVLNLRPEDNATVKSVIIQHGESEAGLTIIERARP